MIQTLELARPTNFLHPTNKGRSSQPCIAIGAYTVANTLRLSAIAKTEGAPVPRKVLGCIEIPVEQLDALIKMLQGFQKEVRNAL